MVHPQHLLAVPWCGQSMICSNGVGKSESAMFVGCEMVLMINLIAWVGNIYNRGGFLLYYQDRWLCLLLRNNSFGRSGGR
ncbi:hypothetical protein V6N13_137972 [Hibiscus sabdariffa]